MKFAFFSRGRGKQDRSERVQLPLSEYDEGASPERLCTTARVCDDPTQVREERVARLRQQVRSGSYEIPVAHLVRILAVLLRRKP
jgi:anti-sigma28 factor (negative regulator of flagellin synthesis)